MTVRAMKGRAVEFTTSPACPRDLLAAVAAVVERDRAAHRAALEAVALGERSERLTPREREVMAIVAAGLLNKQMASELSTTERTVKFYRAHLMRRMHAESPAELVRMADELGIAPDGRAEPVPRDSPDTAPRDSLATVPPGVPWLA
jgi:FixJ family two-component response regulator